MTNHERSKVEHETLERNASCFMSMCNSHVKLCRATPLCKGGATRHDRQHLKKGDNRMQSCFL